MNSQHLEYFCKVAEFGSFSRAAIFLGINQSALSRHVRNLERDLGIQLFYRNGRGVVLTEFGERLLARAARALEEIALAKQEAVNARTETIESVVIGMTPTVGRVLIQPLARELTSSFPNIKLRFMEGFSGHLLEWLDAGRLDLAVLYQGWSGGRLHAEHLIDERLCLVSSKKAKKLKPKTPTAELADVSLILPSAPWKDGSGLEIIPNTYISVGNDGLHHNNSIQDPPTIPEGASYASALHSVRRSIIE